MYIWTSAKSWLIVFNNMYIWTSAKSWLIMISEMLMNYDSLFYS